MHRPRPSTPPAPGAPVSPANAALLLVLAVAAPIALSGCETVSGVFGDRDNTEPPAELVDLSPSIEVRELWSRKVGSGVSDQYLKLHPVVTEGRVYAADRKGEITAYDALTGDRIWDADADTPISGGPGVGAGLVAVGTSNGEILAFSADTGEPRWHARVSSEVLSTPAVAENAVVVRTIDGKLFGLDARDGSRLWVYDRAVPVLTLRGTSSPAIAGDVVVAGFDSGRLVAVSLLDGQPLWETAVAEPRGRSELERIVDIDADPIIADGVVYVATFQGRIAALDLESGTVLWRRDMSSHAGIGLTSRLVVVTDEGSSVWALERGSSSSMWRQSKLERRGLTAPAGFRDWIVVCDFEGYVHWLNRDDGGMVARVRADSDGVIAPPVATEDAVYVYGRSGELTAYTVGG